MTNMATTLLYIFLSVLFCSTHASKSWTLLHSFDSGKTFSERGVLTLALSDEGALEFDLKNNENCVADTPLSSSKHLYQLKIKYGDSEVFTSVPACQVRRANFRDELVVVLNGQAEPVSLDYQPLVSPLAPSCEELDEKHTITEFTTTKVSYETANLGMAIPSLLPETKPPVGLKFFSKPGSKDGPVPPEDSPSGPQGFLTKYWYIVLPMVLMSLFGGEAPPEEDGGEQQKGGAQPAVATNPAAGASAAGGSGVRQRRGKKG